MGWGSGINLLTTTLRIGTRGWVVSGVHLQLSLLENTGLSSDLAGCKGPAS